MSKLQESWTDLLRRVSRRQNEEHLGSTNHSATRSEPGLCESPKPLSISNQQDQSLAAPNAQKRRSPLPQLSPTSTPGVASGRSRPRGDRDHWTPRNYERRLFNPNTDSTQRRRPYDHEAAPNPEPRLLEVDPDRLHDTSLVPQLETKAISHEQLVAEVKGIYTGLVMIESKCIEVDTTQSSSKDHSLSSDQWWALIALHRTLLHEHHHFYLDSQHPVTSKPPRRPTNMRQGCFGGLARHQGAIDYDDMRDRLVHASRPFGKSNNRPTLYSRRQSFNVDGIINDIQIEANVDSGSSFNIISASLASQLGLVPEPKSGGYVSLPNRRKIFSPGRVNASFKFVDEPKARHLHCIILAGAPHALTLGSKFLKLTRTMTTHMHRLKKVLSSSPLSLNLLGDEQEAIEGYLNGSPCLAIPDSGSDVMVISGTYARAHGLKVKREYQHRILLEFIDGSRSMTDGLVEGLQWQFRNDEEPIVCDFHVIDDLSVDAILSNALIDELDVFTRYEDLFVQVACEDDDSGVFYLRLPNDSREDISPSEDSFVKVKDTESILREIASIEDSSIQDMTCDTPFARELVSRERARRNDIRELISQLPMTEKQNHEKREQARKTRYDQEWIKHHERTKDPPSQPKPQVAFLPKDSLLRQFWRKLCNNQRER